MSREMKDSGISWIGEIPSDWRIGHLKRLARIKTGSTPSRSVEEYYSEKSGLPWIKPGNLNSYDSVENTAEYLTAEGRVAGTVFPQNTVFACCIASIGKIGYSNIEASCNQQINGLIYNDLINWKYGFYSNVAANNEYLARANSSVQFILNSTNQGYIQMPIPSIAEQEIISTFLDSKCAAIDQVIQKQKDIVNKLMEYKQSTITQAVTKGLNPSVEMKNTPISGLTQIPKTWNIVPLKTLFSFSKGLSITKSDLTDEGIKVISYGQIHSKKCDGVHATNELIRFTAEKFKSNNSLAKCGSFIFADTSEDLEGCGNAIYITNEVYGGYHTVILNPKETHDYRYLAYLFKTDAWRTELRKQLTEVKVFSITQFALKNMHVILPSYEEMVQIADFLDSKCLKINKSIERSNKIIQKLEEYKKSLIYNAVTGKIDCRNA
jgi:type I restriction enzyme S subunit